MFSFTSIDKLFNQRIYGVNVRFTQNDDPIIDYIVVARKKDKISILSYGSPVSFEKLFKELSSNVPIYLSVDGKGIIHKVMLTSEDGNDLNRMLPDVKQDEFEIQKIVLGPTKCFISAVRKDKLNDWVSIFKKNGFFLFGISLGPGPVLRIAVNNTEIRYIPDYQLDIEENKIVDIRKLPGLNEGKSFSVENKVLTNNFLIPFSNCLAFFNTDYYSGISLDLFVEQRTNHHFKKLFQRTGWFALITIFIVLFLNYLYFDKLSSENKLLTAQVEQNQELLEQIKQKQDILKAREELISASAFTGDPLFAYYSDRIAKLVPSEISLTRMEIAPPEKSGNHPESINYLKDRILISGITTNSIYLDKFLTEINEYTWVQEIVIRNYYDNNTEPAVFDISIVLKNNGQNK